MNPQEGTCNSRCTLKEGDAEKEAFWEKSFLEVMLKPSFERQMGVFQAVRGLEGPCKGREGISWELLADKQQSMFGELKGILFFQNSN